MFSVVAEKIPVTNASHSEDRRAPVCPCNTGPDLPSGGATGDFLVYMWTQQCHMLSNFVV